MSSVVDKMAFASPESMVTLSEMGKRGTGSGISVLS